LRLVCEEPERRVRLLKQAAQLRQQLSSHGWRIGTSNSQIIPIYIGDPATTMRTAATLRERGLFVPGIRPPSVPDGESLLRISLSYLHDQAMIDRLVGELTVIAGTL
jgi:7-keto-8-aminopelargonate synthetase-like enzyme